MYLSQGIHLFLVSLWSHVPWFSDLVLTLEVHSAWTICCFPYMLELNELLSCVFYGKASYVVHYSSGG